jgi:hypothetical protein
MTKLNNFRILPDRFESVYMVDGEKSVEEVFSQVESIINKEVL